MTTTPRSLRILTSEPIVQVHDECGCRALPYVDPIYGRMYRCDRCFEPGEQGGDHLDLADVGDVPLSYALAMEACHAMARYVRSNAAPDSPLAAALIGDAIEKAKAAIHAYENPNTEQR